MKAMNGVGMAFGILVAQCGWAAQPVGIDCVERGYNFATEVSAVIVDSTHLASVSETVLTEQGPSLPQEFGSSSGEINYRLGLVRFVYWQSPTGAAAIVLPTNFSQGGLGSHFRGVWQDHGVLLGKPYRDRRNLDCTVMVLRDR